MGFGFWITSMNKKRRKNSTITKGDYKSPSSISHYSNALAQYPKQANGLN